MSDFIWVQAAPGVRVPREGVRQHITSDEPVRIAPSAYYRRQLKDGALIQVDAPAPAKPSKRSSK